MSQQVSDIKDQGDCVLRLDVSITHTIATVHCRVVFRVKPVTYQYKNKFRLLSYFDHNELKGVIG